MEPHVLEPAGWALLLGSWGAISALVLFCIRRVLESGRPKDDE